jgi:hypothetical protein
MCPCRHACEIGWACRVGISSDETRRSNKAQRNTSCLYKSIHSDHNSENQIGFFNTYHETWQGEPDRKVLSNTRILLWAADQSKWVGAPTYYMLRLHPATFFPIPSLQGIINSLTLMRPKIWRKHVKLEPRILWEELLLLWFIPRSDCQFAHDSWIGNANSESMYGLSTPRVQPFQKFDRRILVAWSSKNLWGDRLS